MSELALNESSLDLLKLAQDLDINLDNKSNEIFTTTTSRLTPYLEPKNIRTVYDSHKLDGVIKWTPEGFSGDPSKREQELLYIMEGDEPRELGNIIEVQGIIVNYQQRDELRYYDGTKTQILCSVLGYKNNKDDYIKALPNIPYGMKYSFEKIGDRWTVNTTKPNNAVDKLGLVGYRGEKPTSCVECIRCDMSTQIITDESGNEKKISCEARGRLYLAVFNVCVKKRVKNTGGVKGKSNYVDKVLVYPVKDLVNLDGESIGEFFLLKVPLSKSSIQGKYIKNSQGKKDVDATVEGYESFVRGLTFRHKNHRDPLCHPQFHQVKLTFRKNPGRAPTFQADIRSLGPVTPENFRAAFHEWNTLIPERTVETLEVNTLQKMQADGVVNVPYNEVPSTPEPRIVTEVSDDNLEAIPF